MQWFMAEDRAEDKVSDDVRSLVKFLEKYKWIWNVKTTELFLNDHISTNMPSEVMK